MATREEIYTAIRNADKAGDSESVKKLGDYLKTMDAPVAAAPVTAPQSLTDKAVGELKSEVSGLPGKVGNLVAGAVRGAGSIGATILAPVDVAARFLNGGKPVNVGGYDIVGQDRRAGMDAGLTELGADPNSLQFRAGKLGAEVAGTAGAGGLVANGARALGASAPLVDAIASGGFAGGGNALTRAAGGAINGAATAGLVNPEDAGKGAVVGGVLPGAVQLAGRAGNAVLDAAQAGSRRLMQSAIKPTIAQLRTGDADTAVDTLLQYGISPTRGGVNRIRALVDDLNNEISTRIGDSTATVNKGDVLDRAWPSRGRFANQVDPASDLNAIDGVSERFYLNPRVPGDMPVQQAQELKQGTYQVLRKKYGQIGSAETEAQKGLARGLKEEIAAAVPGINDLNAEESRLLTTLTVAERRALMEMNKNPVGLTALAHNPIAAAGFLADRSAAFKALAARMIHNATPAAGAAGQQLVGVAGNPLLRATGLAAVENSP